MLFGILFHIPLILIVIMSITLIKKLIDTVLVTVMTMTMNMDIKLYESWSVGIGLVKFLNGDEVGKVLKW